MTVDKTLYMNRLQTKMTAASDQRQNDCRQNDCRQNDYHKSDKVTLEIYSRL